MNLPNLVGCGAGKSGTTSLYYYLNEHPDIYMVPAKELHFFSRQFEKGVSWYTGQFNEPSNARVVGEFSTSYMLDPLVPKRMAEVIPNAKLLFIFRNPTDRAYSNYWFSLSIGTQVTGTSFSQAIRGQDGYQKYVETGFYHLHLNRFLEYFNQQVIHIIISEEFRSNTLKQMERCYEFLNVDSSFEPNIKSTYNVTLTAPDHWKATFYRSWVKTKHLLRPTLIKLIPGNAKRRIVIVEKRLTRNLASQERPPMAAEDRDYLQGIYHEHNNNLGEFLDRDLTFWN